KRPDEGIDDVWWGLQISVHDTPWACGGAADRALGRRAPRHDSASADHAGSVRRRASAAESIRRAASVSALGRPIVASVTYTVSSIAPRRRRSLRERRRRRGWLRGSGRRTWGSAGDRRY